MDALRESVESASLDRQMAGSRAAEVETSQIVDPQLAEHDSFSVNEVPDEPVLSKRELRALARHQSRIDAKAYKKTANAEIERIRAERAGRSGAVEPRRTAQSMFEPHRSAIVSGVVAFSFVIAVGVFAYVLWDRSPSVSNSPQPSTIASQSGGDSQPAPQEAKNSIEKTNTAANAPVSIQTPNTVVPNNIVAESLKQIGATRCMSRANDLSRAISGTTESVVLQKPFGDPDASLLSVMLLPTAASKVTGASILSLAPNQSNGCGAVFLSIDIIERPCASALPEIFGPNRATPVGTNGFAVVALNSSARVLAIPSSKTCVLVKQEYVL